MTHLRYNVAVKQKTLDNFVPLLTYEYNTQAHCSGNTTPFRLVLKKHPLQPTQHSTKQVHHNHVLENISVQTTRRALETSIRALRSRSYTLLRDSRQQFKPDYDKMVRVTSVFTPVDMIFVVRALHSAAATRSANTTAIATYRKLFAKALGLFHLISVQLYTVMIYEDDTSNKSSVDRATRTSTKARQNTVSGDTELQTSKDD